MINPDQYPKFRLSTLSIASLLSLLLLISPSYLFSQDNSPPSPDFSGNGTVDIPDFLLFVDVFGLKEGQERYDAKYDLDGNGEIGIPDFLIFVDNFGKVVNRVPVFTVDSGGTTPVSSVTLSVDENTSSGQPIGDPISATDGDDDTLTYRLSGADADNFAIAARTGQIKTQGTYDFEQKGSYSVTVVVSDGEGGEASLVVNITINDIEEPTATVPSNVVNDTAPWIYNDNVFVLPVTENLAALWTSSIGPPLEDYTARFYEHFNDEFDFLIFYPNLDLDGLEPGSINGAFYRRVKNDVQGIGLDTFSHNSSWGSAGKLQGVIFHNYDDPSSFRGLLLHELMHRWGNYVVPITSYPYGSHWGLSTSGGYLDCYDISNMIDHGDGKFSAPDPFPTHSLDQYSPIELYLAGFIPPEEVPDFQVAEDGEWLLDERGYSIEDDKGYRMFTASGFKTHTIEDIIAEHGPRVPDHLQAQKDFRAAVILLVSERYPATRERLERLSDDVTWFSQAGKDESGPPVTNFYEATGGRGTITMDGLQQLRRSTGAKRPAPGSFGTPPPIVDRWK